MEIIIPAFGTPSILGSAANRISRLVKGLSGKFGLNEEKKEDKEEAKEGEVCDGYERVYEIVARVISENHTDESLDVENFSIEGLLS